MTTERHAWDRGALAWDAYFLVVLAGTLPLAVITAEGVTSRIIVCVALLALAPLYVLVGRPAIARPRPDRLGGIYLLCLVALVALAQSQTLASSWVMFAACPQCFMIGPLRRAIAAVVALNVTPVVLLLEPGHRSHGQAIVQVGIAVLGVIFAIFFGTWIARIIEQSMERADLIKRLDAAQAELAEVSRRAGTLAERERLAGEIHDTLAQGLTSIVMLLQAADAEIGTDPREARRHVGLAVQTAREGLAEARAMVAALTPAHLEAGPLDEALGRLTARIGAELGIGARFEATGTARALPATAEVVLLRAGQEALANVRKHSGASDVTVVLSYREGAVGLDVTDNGAGFDPDHAGGGYGLRGMRGRILQVGGSFWVCARPGGGTSLSVEVPG